MQPRPLPFRRALILALGVAAALIPAPRRAAAGPPDPRPTYSRVDTFQAQWRDNTLIVVDEPTGSVNIAARADSKTIHIRARKTVAAPDLPTAREQSGRIQISISSADRAVYLRATRPPDWDPGLRASADYTITAPPGARVLVRTGSGAVILTGPLGDTRALTISGPIRIDGASGTVRADSVSGPVRILNAPRTAHAASAFNIIFFFTFNLDAPSLELLSATGDITAAFPPKPDLRVDAFSSAGALKLVDFKEWLNTPAALPFHYTFGNGKAAVTAATLAGDILLGMAEK